MAHLEAATMNETVERLSKAFSIQKLPINPEIQKKRDELLQCYQQNPGKTLLCSEVVKDFSRSVHSSRTVSLQKYTGWAICIWTIFRGCFEVTG